MKTVVIVTGGFDPLHLGHIKYFKSAKKLGDILVVGINSDAWLQRKKKSFLLPFKERKGVIENLKMVDNVINFNDNDKLGFKQEDFSDKIHLSGSGSRKFSIIFASILNNF